VTRKRSKIILLNSSPPFFSLLIQIRFQFSILEKPFLSLAAPGDLPCVNSSPLSLRTCRWASNNSGWPKRSLAAGRLRIIGMVPSHPRRSLQETVFPANKVSGQRRGRLSIFQSTRWYFSGILHGMPRQTRLYSPTVSTITVEG
jgi:hypothetical protein